MKLKIYLFACALTLSLISAHAEIVGGIRQKPVPATETMQLGVKQYLYNVGGKGFFIGANDYSTRASLGDTGYKVCFRQQQFEGLEWDGKSYIFTDSVETQKKELMVWIATAPDSLTEEGGDVWVDWNGQADTIWAVTFVGDNKYRITAGTDNDVYNSVSYPNRYFGWNSNLDKGTNTRLWAFLKDKAGNYIDWSFVSVEAYNAYLPLLAQYTAAVELKKYIDEAKGAGIDVTAFMNIYLDESKTVEELNEAIEAVKKAIAEAAEHTASVKDPKDMSTLITNATFDVVGDFTGWNGTAFGAGGTTAACAEHYNKTYDTYQTLSGAPKGVYALKANAFYRAGNTSASWQSYKKGDASIYNAKLYAKNGDDVFESTIMNNFEGIEPNNPLGVGDEASVTEGDYTYYSPNTMQAAVGYFEQGYYADNEVLFATTDGTPVIGVKKSSTVDADWSIFDNFTLTYYGNGEDAYQYWMDKYIEDLTDYSVIEYVTGSYLEAFQTVKENARYATDYATAIANMQKIKEAEVMVAENVDAWKQLLAVIEKAKEICGDETISGDEVMALADYVEFELEDALNEKTMTTEEILAEVKKVSEMIDAALQNGLSEGADFTKYMVNPNFDDGKTGWSGVYTAVSNSCAESWNQASFDMYQEITGAPVGVYEIQVQGFYRELRGDNAWNAYFESTGEEKPNKPTSKAYVYMNDNKTPLRNVFEERVPTGTLYSDNDGSNPFYKDPLGEYDYPNNMTNAHQAFDTGLYKSSAFGLIAHPGDKMRIGIKGNTSTGGDSWAIWDSFKLVYQAFKADIIKPELEKAIASLAEIEEPMGCDIKAKLDEVLANATAALATGEGKIMFDALSAIFEINETVEKSVNLFKTLNEGLDHLADAISVSESSDETRTAAALLYQEVMVALASGTYTDEEATAKLNEISQMISKLKLPNGYEDATDDDPCDLTCLIQSPSFDVDGVNSIAGWQGTTGYNFGNDDNQKSALAIEFYQKTYNMYQELVGLPNGTYKVEVNAFYRYGSTTDDYEHFLAGDKGLASMYGVTTGDSIQNDIMLLAEGGMEEEAGVGAEATITTAEGTTLYVPNDMLSAVEYFNCERYFNHVIVKVTDGKLRIGITQKESVNSGWMIMDNWTLTYYGPNSKQLPWPVDGLKGDANEDGAVDVADITAIASYILGNEPTPFNAFNADANDDGSIDVADITTVASIILTKAKEMGIEVGI